MDSNTINITHTVSRREREMVEITPTYQAGKSKLDTVQTTRVRSGADGS